MIRLLFVNAISLSVIAEYYAIMGLMAIFSGAPISIAIMGGILGVSKIVITSWLYRNWKETGFLLKTYFFFAIVILMFLTSMGIFGYLSKAHLDQSILSGDVIASIEIIDEKIKYQKEIINDSRKTLSQLDKQVDETINRTSTQSTTAGVDRSVTIRRAQAKERADLAATITSAQREIARLTEEKAPIATELRKVEAEVGPIKYIAAFIYEDQTDKTSLEKAVRWLIVLIVLVFDPLAVLMFIAINQSMLRKNPQSQPVTGENIIEVKEDIPPGESNHIRTSTVVSVSDKFTIEKF